MVKKTYHDTDYNVKTGKVTETIVEREVVEEPKDTTNRIDPVKLKKILLKKGIIKKMSEVE